MHGFGTGGQIGSSSVGFSGFSGYSAYSGFSGFSGFSAYSGFSGFSGLSAYSGYSGFSGLSAYSGYSGYSGFVGTLSFNPQADDYTLLAADETNVLIQMSKGSATTLNIPTDATYNFTVGTTISVIGTGAGPVTIQATTAGTDPTGTEVLSTGATAAAPVLRVQYSSATLIKKAANSWYVVGDII